MEIPKLEKIDQINTLINLSKALESLEIKGSQAKLFLDINNALMTIVENMKVDLEKEESSIKPV